MGRHRSVESGVQQRDVQDLRSRNPQSRFQHGSRYVISRPPSSQRSSVPQSVGTAASANRLAQFKSFPAEVSRSIVRHPLRWLGATWLVLVGVGSVSAVTLFRINPTELTGSSSDATVEHVSPPLPDQPQPVAQSPAHPSEPSSIERSNPIANPQKESLPLFALGSVAFSCAIGCLWLSYRFRTGPSKSQAYLLTNPHRPPRSSAPAQRSTKAVPISVPITSTATRSNQESAPVPSVAIVPDSEDHPLDWDEPSLADNLDIRQQRPLSRWL